MMTIQCCKCKGIYLGGRWHTTGILDVSKGPISHTYCPECLLATHVQLTNEVAGTSNISAAKFVAESVMRLTELDVAANC